MMRIRIYAAFLILMVTMIYCKDPSIGNVVEIDSIPNIFPDYTSIIIPPNIAPMNFIVNEVGDHYIVKFNADDPTGFSVKSETSEIVIPEKKWQKLLEQNSGGSIKIDVFIRDCASAWKQFKRIENRVSKDSIDPYIAYRRINTALILWNKMAIAQRSLENFDESDIISNENTENNCIHCHTFQNRDPNSMLLHMRMTPGGTLIKTKEKTLWLSTKTQYTLSSFVYPAWHPEGRYIAFSTNKIHQSLFGRGERVNHVRDDASDIVIYDLIDNEVFTSPELASKDFENLPAWSPDGKYLYYIQSPHEYKNLPDSMEKYDLMRIEFDQENRKWGKAEMLVSSENTGLSVSFPQVSPDGKHVIFCMANYGYFNITNLTSDLYLLNIENNKITKLPVNSDQTESFPSWSGNGRWIVFASKRMDGRFTLPFFSFVDSAGTAGKAFVIPFKNPATYQTRLTNMNRPVFIAGRVEYTQKELLEIAYTTPENVTFDTINVDIDALAGATISTTSAVDETDSLYKKN